MSSSPDLAPIELFLDHLTVERGLSRNTLLAYRRDLYRYLAFLESRGKKIESADEPDVEEF